MSTLTSASTSFGLSSNEKTKRILYFFFRCKTFPQNTQRNAL
jgi:hypothetical protein